MKLSKGVISKNYHLLQKLYLLEGYLFSSRILSHCILLAFMYIVLRILIRSINAETFSSISFLLVSVFIHIPSITNLVLFSLCPNRLLAWNFSQFGSVILIG